MVKCIWPWGMFAFCLHIDITPHTGGHGSGLFGVLCANSKFLWGRYFYPVKYYVSLCNGKDILVNLCIVSSRISYVLWCSCVKGARRHSAMPNNTDFVNMEDDVSPLNLPEHYNDVTMSKIASQIISLTIVYSTVYSGPDQTKHQSSASLAFVRGIHRGPVNSPHKWPVTRKMFPFDDVIMNSPKRVRPLLPGAVGNIVCVLLK